MRRLPRQKFYRLVPICIALGLLTNLCVFNFATVNSAEAHSVRISQPCSGLDYYDTWYPSIYNSAVTMKQQMHYRVNTDCSWKGYWESTSTYSCNSICNVWSNGFFLYQGVNLTGSSRFDTAATGSCRTTSGTTSYFGQVSAYNPYVFEHTAYWTDPGCVHNFFQELYEPYYQPGQPPG